MDRAFRSGLQKGLLLWVLVVALTPMALLL